MRHRPRKTATAQPPPAMLAVQRDLQARLISSGGRPSDPEPTIRRLVPVRARVWKELANLASRLSRLGQRITVGQLAAFLLEKGASELQLPSSTRR